MKKELGIIGFGRFGKLIAQTLKPYFNITVYDPHDSLNKAEKLGVKDTRKISEVALKPIVILSVPVPELKQVIKDISSFVKKGTTVIDVSSVKVIPTQLMKKYLPNGITIIPTHPLFGPESVKAKGGLDDLRIVICGDENNKKIEDLIKFLKNTLKLKVLIKTPDEHDKEMAYVQGITHFFGRVVREMNFPDSDQSTLSYLKLQEGAVIVSNDTEELFMTIEKDNPYAQKVRKEFIKKMLEVDKKIEKYNNKK